MNFLKVALEYNIRASANKTSCAADCGRVGDSQAETFYQALGFLALEHVFVVLCSNWLDVFYFLLCFMTLSFGLIFNRNRHICC